MKDETIDVEFTKSLHDFLSANGYTHMFYKGVDSSESAADTHDKFVYWLEPLKSCDTRIAEDAPDFMVAEIQSDDIIKMANSQGDSVYMIKIPIEDMNTYLKDR